MLPDPPDHGNAVFCQTCESWEHPRSECARDAAHETTALPVMDLRRHGPLSGANFDGTSYESKQKHGIAKFDLTAHATGRNSTFGATKSVYYLNSEHPAEDVVETWIQVNADILKQRDLTTENITRALSKQRFKKAWKRLRAEEDFEVLSQSDHSDRGGDHYEYKQCPVCGETVKQLPGHLPCPEQ